MPAGSDWTLCDILHLEVCIEIIILNTKFINFNAKLIDFNPDRYLPLAKQLRPIRLMSRSHPSRLNASRDADGGSGAAVGGEEDRTWLPQNHHFSSRGESSRAESSFSVEES